MTGGRDKHVPPNTDPTSRSLREIVRRGTLVVPGERELIIERGTTDLTSRSLHWVAWRVGFHRDR